MSDYNPENHHGDHHEEIERRRAERARYREALEQALWVCRELSEEVNALDGLSNLTNGMSGVSVAYLNAKGTSDHLEGGEEDRYRHPDGSVCEPGDHP